MNFFLNLNILAFTKFIPSPNGRTYNLAVSSFNGVPFSSDFISYISNITLRDSTYKINVLNNNKLVWPNEVTWTEGPIIGVSVDPYGGLLVGAGFLVPTKSNGGLFYYPFKSQDRSQVTPFAPFELSSTGSPEPHNWFYHRAKLVDIDGDGNSNDILTCRSYKPLFGATKTELVAFILNNKTETFTEQVIMPLACDIFYDLGDIDKDGRFEIVAAGFFISELNIIYSDDSKNNFLNNNAKKITIDSTAGKIFDVKLSDLDLDSRLEILATNHQGNRDEPKGAIFYYKMSGDNIRKAIWTKHLIYNNFPVLKTGIQQAAPGGPVLLKPKLTDQLDSILLAGDGSEYAYLFEPVIDALGNLNYTMTWSELFKNTVGGIGVSDLDGDGYSEFTIPSYEENAIYLYTFAP